MDSKKEKNRNLLKKILDLKGNKNLKKIVKIIGYILTGVSILYVGYVWYSNWQNISQESDLYRKFLWILPCILIYLILSYLLPLAWGRILKGFGANISYYDNLNIYGKSQIAKYVPGNVFHYVGRHFLSKKYGFDNGIIINGIFAEIIMQIIVSAIIGLGTIALIDIGEFSFLNLSYYIILFSFIFIVVVIFVVFFKFSKPFKNWLNKNKLIVPLEKLNTKSLILEFLIALIIYALYCLLNGLNLWLLSYSFWGITFSAIPFIISGYAIAWLVGFITPGSPGGLGIREAMLILLLTTYVGESRALIISLLFRIISVVGDLLFFAITYIMQLIKEREIKKAEKSFN